MRVVMSLITTETTAINGRLVCTIDASKALEELRILQDLAARYESLPTEQGWEQLQARSAALGIHLTRPSGASPPREPQ